MSTKDKRNMNASTAGAKSAKPVTLPVSEIQKHVIEERKWAKQIGARNVLTYLVHKEYISVGAAITAALNGFEAETDSECNPF